MPRWFGDPKSPLEVLHTDLCLVPRERFSSLVLALHIGSLPTLFLRIGTLGLEVFYEAGAVFLPLRVLLVELGVFVDSFQFRFELANVVARVRQYRADRLVLLKKDSRPTAALSTIWVFG
jgi:hypothetical protein